jgi:hypothetical protein
VRKTDKPGNHRFAKKWILRCECGHEFGANGCDAHERLCPKCEDGAPGLPVEMEGTLCDAT